MFGFAFGPGGNALKGKDFLLSITTGGSSDSYSESRANHFPIESFFLLMSKRLDCAECSGTNP
jgi:putative NADPH-quinone reductase